MSVGTDAAIIRYAKNYPRVFLGAAAAIILVGGFFMARDLAYALVNHNKATLFKFAFLFATVIFGSVRYRARYARVAEKRDSSRT
jgi:hypothetical protein